MIYEKNSSFCEFYNIFLWYNQSFWYEFLDFFLIQLYERIIDIETPWSPESKHQFLECDLFGSEQLFSYPLSLIVSWKRFTIGISHTIDITRSRESESPRIWVIPVRLIMFWFIAWTSPIREFIVIPSDIFKILNYS
jgi:hypothetical protein